MTEIDTYAHFKIQGKVKEELKLQTSSKGSSYLRFQVRAGQGPNKYPRSYFLIAFGDVAEQIARTAKRDDVVVVVGELQINKNETRGLWETTYVVRRCEVVEHSVNNNVDMLKEAFDATEEDGIPF